MLDEAAPRVIGVSGASGYIGQALLRAVPDTWQVMTLGRRLTLQPGVCGHRWLDLAVAPDEALLDGLDGLVHLAAGVGRSRVDPEREIACAIALAKTAQQRGIPMVFVSSQASSPKAPTSYGLTKAAIESHVLPLNVIVVRPGQVYGGSEQGLFGSLCHVLRRGRIVPQLWPSPLVQPIHVDDLAAALVAALRREECRGRVLSVADRPIAFNRFMRAVAQYRLGAALPAIPVPVAILRGLLGLGRLLPGSTLDAGRLDSLVKLPVMNTAADLKLLGVVPRDLRDGMTRSGTSRRRLLEEGRAMGRALHPRRDRFPSGLLRRYVRAVEQVGNGTALPLPPALLRQPTWIAALDRAGSRVGAPVDSLSGRLEVASRLCEATPELANVYLGLGGRRRGGGFVVDIIQAAFIETFARLRSPVARLLLRVLE